MKGLINKMNELKMLQGESFLEFCNRVVLDFKSYGFSEDREAYERLTGINMKDNTRKYRRGVHNIQKAIDSGYSKQFESESVIEIGEGLNECYKSEDIKLKEELELSYNTLTKVEKALQRSRDENTLLRAEKRKLFRDDNGSIIDLEDILSEIRKDRVIKPINIKSNLTIENKSVMLPIHDLHYNFTQEEEDEMVYNYINSVENNLDGTIPEEIIFAFISDLVNHSKYGKKYTNLYSKGEASTKAFMMISRIMNHFIQSYPSINYKCCSVVGNESDENEMFMNEPKAGYDNKDYYIYQMLKAKFSECVEFMNEGNDIVFVGKIRDKTFAINHGYFQTKLSKRNNIEEFFHTMQAVIRKDLGKEIDFLCIAHIHSAINSNNRIMRGGSWEGSNSYSKFALGIAESYRTQLMIVVTDNNWHSRVIEF